MEHVKMVHRGKPKLFGEVMTQLTGLDRTQTNLLIAMGGAYLGKRRCKDPGQKVKSGDLAAAYFRLPLVMEPVVFDPAWIVADNARYLVAAKPSGLPTQGRRDADYMAFYVLLDQHLKGYLGLHHRLDQDTSGLLLFSRERPINKDIARVFAEGLIHKEYLAVCSGSWPFDGDTAVIDLPIGSKTGSRGTVHRVMQEGKKAVTHVTRLAWKEHMGLVRVSPKTGRTHQIRVHLAHHGLPLVGDTWYGGPAAEYRFLLHCARLAWSDCGRLKAADFNLPVPDHWKTLPHEISKALY